MRYSVIVALLVVLLCVALPGLQAGPFVMVPVTKVTGPYTMTQVPSIAPNAYGSPSWDQYVTNAIAALEAGSTTGGTPGTAAYYEAVTSGVVPLGDLVASSFNSWRGVTPGAFAGEFGNRLHYGLRIVSSGPAFQLAGLWNDMNSTDALNLFNNDGGYGTGLPFTAYSAAIVGINYGLDGVKGGGDDIIYTAGPASLLVHELLYVGVGNAIWADYSPGATPQDKLNSAAAYVAGMNVNNNYCLYDPGTGQLLSCVVPEPASGLLLLAGLGGLVAVRRFRRR